MSPSFFTYWRKSVQQPKPIWTIKKFFQTTSLAITWPNHCLKNVFIISNFKFIPNYSGVYHSTARQHYKIIPKNGCFNKHHITRYCSNTIKPSRLSHRCFKRGGCPSAVVGITLPGMSNLIRWLGPVPGAWHSGTVASQESGVIPSPMPNASPQAPFKEPQTSPAIPHQPFCCGVLLNGGMVTTSLRGEWHNLSPTLFSPAGTQRPWRWHGKPEQINHMKYSTGFFHHK